MRTRPIIALALLSVAVVAGLAVWELRPRPKPPAPASDRSDYTLENFELVTLDEEGLESFTVKAPHLERDPKGKTLTLRTPTFSFPDKDGGRNDRTVVRADQHPDNMRGDKPDEPDRAGY